MLQAIVGGDHERFTFGRKLPSPAQEFNANGAIHFSVGEDPCCHHDKGAIVKFIANSVLDSLGFHKSGLPTLNNVVLSQASQKVSGDVRVGAFAKDDHFGVIGAPAEVNRGPFAGDSVGADPATGGGINRSEVRPAKGLLQQGLKSRVLSSGQANNHTRVISSIAP